MLKRKFYSAAVIISSFLLMSVTTINAISSNDTLSPAPLPYKSFVHQFDSAGLCTCIPFTDSCETDNAPRIELNKNVKTFVNDYIKKNGYFLGKTRKVNAAYFKIMDAVFEDQNMPVELKYLAFVESGLKRNAGSSVGAVGPWAFMPVAAKEYGLKLHERFDYTKSTRAAAALLSDLYDRYGDWLMVVAAYNCGPGGIEKAIKKSGSRHYWALQNFLPEETRKHVKKFIAVHYYFEGHGSLVTLTKSERENHIRAVEEFTAQRIEKQDTIMAEVMR